MSTAMIDALRNILAGLLEPDQQQALFELLAGDAAAASDGFPVCIVASDSTFLTDLTTVLPGAVALQSFNEVVEWTADECLIMERAGVLVAGTTARQLLPRTLVEALNMAAGAGTPIALIVSEVGRTNDPQATSSGVGRQLEETLSNARAIHVCLGDTRFHGPDLAGGVMKALALRGTQAKGRALVMKRAELVRSALAERIDQVSLLSHQLAENSSLLRQKEQASVILTRATTAAWYQHIALLREALASVDPSAIVDQARGTDRGVAMIQRALELIRESTSESLNQVKSDAEPLVMAELEQLAKTIRADIHRSRESLVSLGNPVETCEFDLEEIREKVRISLASVVDEILAALDVPTELLALARWFERRDNASEFQTDEDHDRDESNNNDNDRDIKNDDGRNAPKEDEAEERSESRLRRVVAQMPEHLIAVRLEAALIEALSEADNGAGLAINTAVDAWKQKLPDTIEQSYSPLHDACVRASHEASSRLDKLLAAFREIDSIGGGSGQPSE